jgi:hypothetical protein
VYARRIEDMVYTFGVSGLLYASNVLMYDHQTESLWLQVRRAAVTGPMTGTKLKVIPSSVTTWDKWRKKHPETQVLSLETGHQRDYSRDPYEDYYKNRRGLFARLLDSKSTEDKVLVAGIEINGEQRAYPVETVRSRERFEDTLGGTRIIFSWDGDTDSISVITVDSDPVEHLVAYWFVWKDIHPDTTLYTGDTSP